MEAFEIISARKRDNNSLVLTIKDRESEEHEDKCYAAIRMGIHWPTLTSPACFVIVAQDYPVSGNQGRRELIAEYISDSIGMNDFYRKIVHYADNVHCHTIYAVLPDDHDECGYLQDLEKFSRDFDCSLRFEKSFSGDDIRLSISRIKDSMDSGSLKIPENSMVFEQLTGITRDDLLDSPEERFYSIDALGHALDGFYRYPPSNNSYVNRPSAPY